MSFQIFDFFTKKRILPFKKNEYQILFLKDDSYKVLNDKITVSTDIPFPEMVVIINSEPGVLLVKSLINVITKEIGVEQLMSSATEITNMDSAFFKKLYKKLREQFKSLEEKYLKITLIILLRDIVPGFFDEFNSEVSEFLEESVINKKQLLKKYIIKVLDLNYTDYVSKSEDPEIFDYSVISLALSFSLISSNIPLDIEKIIQKFPLDNNVPVMFTIDPNDFSPTVKAYSGIPKEQLEKWLVRDGTNGDFILKKPKGMTFKVIDNSGSYITGNLSRYAPRVLTRINYISEEKKKFSDILLELEKFTPFIKKTGIILNIDTKIQNINIKNINIEFIIKKIFVLKSLSECVEKYFKDIFELQKSSKSSCKLKWNTPGKIVYINIHQNEQVKSSQTAILNTRVVITGIKKDSDINYLIQSVVSIFVKSQGISDQIIVSRKKKNIKELRKKGLLVDAVGCQKSRQPEIISDTFPGQNRISLNSINFECKNKNYLYPGFTSSNILCCFRKNQKNKSVYKRNTSTTVVFKQETSADILRKKIITTNKILDVNRLGVIPEQFEKIFSKNYYRLGNLQNKNSFVNCVKLLSKKTFDIVTVIDNLKPKLFKSLNNGDISTVFSLEDYKKKLSLSVKDIDFTLLWDLLSRLCDVNIFIIDEVENKMICNGELYERDCIIIIKRDNYFEGVVEKKGDTLIRQFGQNKGLLDLYKSSCKTTFVGQQVPLSAESLARSGIDIISQIVSGFNKVSYLQTKTLGIVPVSPSGPMSSVKTIKFSNDLLLDAEVQCNLLSNSKFEYLKPVFQILDSDDLCIGIVTASKLIVPVKKSKKIQTLPVSKQQFFSDTEEVLFKNEPGSDSQSAYNLRIKFVKELYQRIRFTLSRELTVEQRMKILKLKENREHAREVKINIVNKLITELLKKSIKIQSSLSPKTVPNTRSVCSLTISDPFCKNGKLIIDKSSLDVFVKKIVVEILGYSKCSNEILGGTVPQIILDKNEFIKRSPEIIILDQRDLEKFFK